MKPIKRTLTGMVAAAALCGMLLTGCGSVPVASAASQAASLTVAKAVAAAPAVSVQVVEATDIAQEDVTDATLITLGDTITVAGVGAVVDQNTVTIIAGGSYRISGELRDGQVIVNSADKETVRLILDSAKITCSTSAGIYVQNAEKTVITLASGSQNYVTDGAKYVLQDATSNEPSAAVFSNDDLTINGAGSLVVTAKYKNGIQSDDDLRITGGKVTVNAVNDGLKGQDSITVREATITVTAGGDGMQSDNADDPAKGIVTIESGTVTITAGEDGIQAETDLVIHGGALTVVTGGGSANGSSGNVWGQGNAQQTSSTSSDTSAKGLKAGSNLSITGGVIRVDSADDALHSNDSLVVNGGEITIACGDDAIHADARVEINGGDINITQCYEAIESTVITLNDGTVHLVAADDGLNIAGGDAASAQPGQGAPGAPASQASTDNHLDINGGYYVINANGDGIDVNGYVTMTGGTVLINGPTGNDNGAVDYDGGFQITGGLLVAVGSAGMAEAPDTSSTQLSMLVNLSASQTAKTLVSVKSSDGTALVTFAPTKTYQSVVVSSPELTKGTTYTVSTGGSSTGVATDGLYAGGATSGGAQAATLTLSGVVTTSGAVGGGFGGGRGR